MTSLRYLTCLFLLTVSLTDLSKAGCRDEFTKNAWKNDLTNRLPENIFIQMDRKPEDVMKCSIKNTVAEPTLAYCFEDSGDCEGESNSSTPVIYFHLMCLTDISMNLTENEESKTIAAGVCKVYEKVCKPFLQSSSTPAPKTTTATASPSSPKMTTPTSSKATATTASPTTATASPSSPKMTTPTSSKATATTASPTTATAPPSSPKMTTPTSSKATATTASPTTATAPPSSPKMTTPTSSKATETTASTTTPTTATAPLSSPETATSTSSTATTASPTTATAPPSSPETATSTSSTATTVSPATPTTESITKTATAWQSASEGTDKHIGACATDIFKLQIVIVFLIFTNILGPLAVYIYMRRQRNKESFNVNRNMPDTVQMMIQPPAVIQIEDSGEGAVLLKTSQCSVIRNPPETTQTEKLNALDMLSS